MAQQKQEKGASSKRVAKKSQEKPKEKRLSVEEQAEIDRNKKKAMIIQLLPRKNYHVGKVCEAVGITRKTFYRWRENDQEFDESISDAMEFDIDDSEEKLKLLRHGIPKVDASGKLVGWIVKPHFGALVTHLKAKAKDRGYGDTLTINGDRTELMNLTDDELMKQAAVLFKNYKDGKWDTSNDEQGTAN